MIFCSTEVQGQKVSLRFSYCCDTLKQFEKHKLISFKKSRNEKSIRISSSMFIKVSTLGDSVKFTLLTKGDTIETSMLPISYFESKRSIIHFQKYSDFEFYNTNYLNSSRLGKFF
jgi:hypothetical protein